MIKLIKILIVSLIIFSCANQRTKLFGDSLNIQKTKFKDLRGYTWYWVSLKNDIITPGIFIDDPHEYNKCFIIGDNKFYSEQIEKIGPVITEPQF